MASSGYTAWSVTAGEIPTTAYWNILGYNDASFNNGNGFNDAILQKRHFASNVVPGSAYGTQTAFFAYVSTAIACTNSTWQVINYQTIWYNTGANPYSYSSGAITVPYTGLYQFYAQNSFQNAADLNNYLVGYSINNSGGGPNFPWSRFYASANGSAQTVMQNTTLLLNANDVVWIYYYAGSASTSLSQSSIGTGNRPTGGDTTYVSIQYLGTAV